jgi:hypothetical protein
MTSPQYIYLACHTGQIKVQIEVAGHLCGVMISHRVVLALVREILQVPDLCMIWMTLPYDMTMLMPHIVGAHESAPSINLPASSFPSPPPPPRVFSIYL